jgi:hypothetical protein
MTLLLTYPSERPEEVGILIFIDSQYMAARRNDLHLQHLVCSQAVSRSEDGMAAARDVAADADALGTAANNSTVVLVRHRIDIVHGCAAADGDGVARNRPFGAVESELPAVVLNLVHVMHPN